MKQSCAENHIAIDIDIGFKNLEQADLHTTEICEKYRLCDISELCRYKKPEFLQGRLL